MSFPTANDDILQIIYKYSKEESLLNDLLRDKEQYENKSDSSSENKCNINVTRDDAIKRNHDLLKEFELIKARLRSEAIFCPTEIAWDDICRQYQQAPSLSITSWRCHLPIFV